MDLECVFLRVTCTELDFGVKLITPRWDRFWKSEAHRYACLLARLHGDVILSPDRLGQRQRRVRDSSIAAGKFSSRQYLQGASSGGERGGRHRKSIRSSKRGVKGRLAWPLEASRQARVDQSGLLIPAEPGSSVTAVAPGRVAYADWLRGYGLLVILDHGDGYMSLYAHNHTLYKEVGDWVAGGEALGEVGTSGGRADPALYFELRHDGEPISALAWLRPARG